MTSSRDLLSTDERPRGRGLDALIAERLFGFAWHRSSVTGRRCLYAPGRAPEWMQERATGDEYRVTDWDLQVPCYSEDIGAASDVEAEIERRGLIVEYACALWEVMQGVKLLPGHDLTPAAVASLLRATPEQRCWAALSVLEPHTPSELTR